MALLPLTPLLTLSAHARARVTVVTFSVCLSQTDFEDGFILSLRTGIKARQVTV